jgi:hypothetical protein
MVCPHCRAPLPEAAAACPACGVDLMKLKARDVLAKLKAAAPAPAAGEPPWLRSAVFLAALAAGACLLLYGSALIVGRRAGAGPAASAPAPAPQAPRADVAEAPAPPALPPLGDRRPPPEPEKRPNLNAVYFDGSPGSPLPPPPPPPPR